MVQTDCSVDKNCDRQRCIFPLRVTIASVVCDGMMGFNVMAHACLLSPQQSYANSAARWNRLLNYRHCSVARRGFSNRKRVDSILINCRTGAGQCNLEIGTRGVDSPRMSIWNLAARYVLFPTVSADFGFPGPILPYSNMAVISETTHHANSPRLPLHRQMAHINLSGGKSRPPLSHSIIQQIKLRAT